MSNLLATFPTLPLFADGQTCYCYFGDGHALAYASYYHFYCYLAHPLPSIFILSNPSLHPLHSFAGSCVFLTKNLVGHWTRPTGGCEWQCKNGQRGNLGSEEDGVSAWKKRLLEIKVCHTILAPTRALYVIMTRYIRVHPMFCFLKSMALYQTILFQFFLCTFSFVSLFVNLLIC